MGFDLIAWSHRLFGQPDGERHEDRSAAAESAYPMPWYTREDRWAVARRTTDLPEGVRECVEPTHYDPCFGPDVALRSLGDGAFEVFVNAGQDDGRDAVRMSKEGLAILKCVIDSGLHRRTWGGFTVAGTSRDLTDEEAKFLSAAIQAVISTSG